MTTEIEKQFFDAFGIEPISCKDNKNCTGTLDCTECPKAIYPQISDHVLLQLICICSPYGFCLASENIKDLKLNVLKRLCELKESLKNNYEYRGYYNAFVRNVQTLFKEE